MDTTSVTKSVPLRLSHLANRGNRSLDAARELLDDLEAAREYLDIIIDGMSEMESACDDYESNDPAEVSGVDDREYARDARTDAYDLIQESAGVIAEAVDSLIEALGMEAMR